MKFTFDIVGVSPVLYFFNHQQNSALTANKPGVEYISTHICTLDAVIKSVEPIPKKWGWDMDEVVGTVIKFWMNNAESVGYWKTRLNDAGNDNLLVARVADVNALQAEFEALLNKNW
jgi:ethanolamine utilization protein EutP (predicted NTPase)